MFVDERFRLSDATRGLIRGMEPQFGYNGFGEFIYYRTYSREICHQCRRGLRYGTRDTLGHRVEKPQDYCPIHGFAFDYGQETWHDTVIRGIEGTFSIRKDWYVRNHIGWDEDFWQHYARHMAVSMFRMEWMPPGRGLWAMGTDFVYERGAMALNNCAYGVIGDDIGDAVSWMMDALMCGCGVGFTPTRDDDLKIYVPRGTYDYVIPDSREGWCEATKVLINCYLSPGLPKPKLIYDIIRPAGQPIRGFGGISSGPESLKRFHGQVEGFMEMYAQHAWYDSVFLKTDIANTAGCAVIAGNVRRSAELMAGELDDVLAMKDYEKYPYRESHGFMSNNSACLREDEDFERLGEIARGIIRNGEPGFLNLRNLPFGRIGKSMVGLQPDPAIGINPCAEMPLQDRELCCLAETCPTIANDPDVWLKSAEYATMYASTVTLLPTHRPETNAVMLKNRRIGVGIIDVAGWQQQIGTTSLIKHLRAGYDRVRSANRWANSEAGVPEAIRVTTVKPGGCRPAEAITTTDAGVYTLGELFSDHTTGSQWSEYRGSARVVQDGRDAKILKTYDNGIAPVYRIECTYGLVLESTENHEWFVCERYKGKAHVPMNRWVTTRRLQPGDVLQVSPGKYAKKSHAKLTTLSKIDLGCSSNCLEISQPLEMNNDIAWFLGYLWGDGCMTSHWRFKFIDQNWSCLDKARQIVAKQFGITAVVTSAKGKDAYRLDFANKKLWLWFVQNGLYKYAETGLALIPRVVRESSYDDILAFIAGLIDSDGCVAPREDIENVVIISSADEKFARHIQDVAMAVGVVFGNNRTTSKSRLGRRPVYNLRSTDLSDSDRFKTMETNSLKMSFLLRRPELPWSHNNGGRAVRQLFGKVRQVFTLGERPTFDLQVDGEPWYYAGAVKSHNTTPKLPGLRSGWQWPTFGRTLRRVRVAQNQPVHKLLSDAGVPHEADVFSANTDVFEWPIDQSDGGRVRPATQVSIWEQAMMLVLMQREWSDNAVSNTLYFKPQWNLIIDLDLGDSFYWSALSEENRNRIRELMVFTLWDDFLETQEVEYDAAECRMTCSRRFCLSQDRFTDAWHLKVWDHDPNHEEDSVEAVLAAIAPLTKSVSVLPHCTVGVYRQMPEEGITAAEYERRLAAIRPIDWTKLRRSDGIDEKYCEGPSCEVKYER